MEERKNLVTCKPTEFLKQTNRIRKSAEKWMKATNVLEIRKRKAEGIKPVTADMDPEESTAARVQNAKLIVLQVMRLIVVVLFFPTILSFVVSLFA